MYQAWDLLPSVQCVAIDPESKWVAAANLMGDIAVYEIETGKELAKWRTNSFTSWGIIKSHCYIGGIFAITFAPDGQSIYVAGMGDMRDPMAGNGKQLWQRYDWRKETPELLQESHKDDTGEGLMEALAFHPSGKYFAMAGRLRGGNWNIGLFDAQSGRMIGQAKTGMRITTVRFSSDGQTMYLGGMQGQPGLKDGKFPDFGYLERYSLSEADDI
jgi:WD40 repeat protein